MVITSFESQERFSASEVQVTAVGFRPDQTGTRLEAYPKRMVYGDREYTFVELGMRYLVKKGQEFIRLFDVSDGECSFRLRLDDHNHWTLISMRTA